MEKVFTYDSPDKSPGFLLWKVTNFWQRELKKALKPYGLTHTQFVILAGIFWLSKENKKLTQVAIANHMEIDKMMTSNVLRTLEKRGLVKRKKHRSDTRAKIIQLTDTGFELLELSVKEVEQFDRSFFGKLPEIDIINKGLLKLLGK